MLSLIIEACIYKCLVFYIFFKFLVRFVHEKLIVSFYATILCRHTRVGSLVLIWGINVFIGASCILVEVVVLFFPIIN